jgi:hypothetical protein
MWFFGPALMLNSFLAVAVGLCSLELLLDRRQQVVGIILGAAGLASLVQLKPQFFAGLGAVAGLVGLGRSLGFKPFNPPSWTVLVAGVGTLALAVLENSLLPGSPIKFGAPAWAPRSTGFSLDMAHTERLIVPPLLACLALATWLSRASGPVMHRLGQLSELLAATVFALMFLVTALTFVSFPVHPDIVTRANALGFDYSATSEQWNLAQMLIPLRLLLAVSALAALAALPGRGSMSVRVILVIVVAGLIVASPLTLIARNFASPLAAYEAAEETGLLSLLAQVPRHRELLIAGDLADPAEDYVRPLRGFLLTAYGGHAFYVANLRYWHYTRPDAVRRLENLRAFFTSPWSSWHAGWLARAHITHVLVSTRCLPPWWGKPDIPLYIVGSSGKWTLLKAHGLTTEGSAFPPFSELMKPRYGQSPCL